MTSTGTTIKMPDGPRQWRCAQRRCGVRTSLNANHLVGAWISMDAY